MKKCVWIIVLFLSAFCQVSQASEKVVNVYVWSDVIPDAVIQQFEKETGIKVNFSTYDSNEVMYTKLKSSKNAGYDVVEPSTYYIDRMRRQGMLEKLNKSQLSNVKNLNPEFLNAKYDPKNEYSLPFIWGVTGIFVNKSYLTPTSISKWSDLWDKKYADRLLMLDDTREVFSMALKVLGYSANDTNPQHIKEASLKLKELLPNIKIFSSAVLSILIDEDAHIGMAWNGDVHRANRENKNVDFVYPKDGFVIWVDNFAIPKDAPHRDNAYQFLNFMMRPDIAKTVALYTNFPTANKEAWKLLPPNIKNNPTIYPSHEVLQRGEYQMDVNDDALALYEKYWERLKMGG